MKERVQYEKENPVEQKESGSPFLDRPRQVESMASSGAIVPAVGKSFGRASLQLMPGSSRPRSMTASGETGAIVQRQEEERQPNKTGLPDRLKEGIEQMSGYDLSNVRVNYNSPKPAQVNALAYTQGTAIEVAHGQERHLPHEAWHVVQQLQGRVKEEFKVNGVGVNGDRGLEREADVMGQRAAQFRANWPHPLKVKEKEKAGENREERCPRLTQTGTQGLDKQSAERVEPTHPTRLKEQNEGWGVAMGKEGGEKKGNEAWKLGFGKESASQHPREQVVQRKGTEISHTQSYVEVLMGGEVRKYEVGKEMRALLSPSDPVRGSATGAKWNWMTELRNRYGAIIKGHLLNHDLGGYAVNANLYPITAEANQEHSQRVEQKVKEMLYNASWVSEKNRVYYTVKVDEKAWHDPRKVLFICDWGSECPVGEKRVENHQEIESTFGEKNVARNPGYVVGGRVSVPIGWAHGSRSEASEEVKSEFAEESKGKGRIKVVDDAALMGARATNEVSPTEVEPYVGAAGEMKNLWQEHPAYKSAMGEVREAFEKWLKLIYELNGPGKSPPPPAYMKDMVQQGIASGVFLQQDVVSEVVRHKPCKLGDIVQKSYSNARGEIEEMLRTAFAGASWETFKEWHHDQKVKFVATRGQIIVELQKGTEDAVADVHREVVRMEGEVDDRRS